MFRLTTPGVFHAAISLVAVAAGLLALLRGGAISTAGGTGCITDTTIRLPRAAPLLPNAGAPALQVAPAKPRSLFFAGAAPQVLRPRRAHA